MCRFCACELSKEQLSTKCAYKKDNVEHQVLWSTNSNVVDYYPSTMLQPKNSGLPVIVNGKLLQSTDKRIFCPMYWSLIPPWYKDDPKDWKALTHNARLENLNESKIYSAALNEGKRCIIVMEGFFEFKRSADSQSSEVYYLKSQDNQLLKAAGLFNSLKKENGETLYSCTVITTESKSNTSKVHHRSPLLLNKESDIEAWLDFKSVSSADAVSKIKDTNQFDLEFYKTAKIGSKEPVTKKVLASKSIMSNWLKTTTSKGVKRKAEN